MADTEGIVGGVIYDSALAAVNPMKAIVKIKGTYRAPIREDSKFTNDDGTAARDQIKQTLENATILEMLPGVTEPDLKDDTYVWWMPYAAHGAERPSDRSAWVKYVLGSCKEQGIPFADKIDAEVTMVRVVKPMGKDKDTGQVIEWKGLVFAIDEDATPVIADKVRKNINGLNESMANREVMMGSGKSDPKMRAAAEESPEALAAYLDMDYTDGLFKCKS